MGFDQWNNDLRNAGNWTERHFEDAGHLAAGGAGAAWRWSGRQLRNLGSASAQGIVGAIGFVDSRVAYTVPGHYYDTLVTLGAYPHVTPAMLLDAMRNNPASFPITGDKRFDLGATVTLTYIGTRNPVIVAKIDVSDPARASMLLKTKSGHFFRGTAEHIILRRNGNLIYEIIGHGPKDELIDRYDMNMGFGKHIWPLLVRQSVVPLANKLERSFAGAGK